MSEALHGAKITLQGVLARARSEKRAAFIPYITAGDPNLTATRSFVELLAAEGSDIIELGVPFSDPVADGPTNQAAADRALASGTTLPMILDFVRQLRAGGFATPIVLFTYLNPIHKMGFKAFTARAAECGVTGVLLVDMPPEEAEREYLAAMKAAGLETIFLASPTTAEDRLPLIDSSSSGFVYYASRTGVTGAQAALSSTLLDELKRVRGKLKKPVAVGFGISTPEQARALAPHADAVVVGSALVKLIEQDGGNAGAALKALTRSLVKELIRE